MLGTIHCVLRIQVLAPQVHNSTQAVLGETFEGAIFQLCPVGRSVTHSHVVHIDCLVGQEVGGHHSGTTDNNLNTSLLINSNRINYGTKLYLN